MALELKKFLDDHYSVIILTVLVGILTVWAFIDYSDHWADASGAYFCGKSCQAQLKANDPANVKPEPCYGLYCPDPSKPTATNTTHVNPAQKSASRQEIIKHLNGKNFISLRVSTSCKKLDETQCPNEKKLADMYDNSNKYLSGNFYFDNKTNAWKRTSPIIPNAFELYKFIDNMPWTLWVNPDDYTWDRSKQIVIEPSLRYIKRTDGIDNVNRIRYEYEGLSMVNCAKATIGWENNGSTILLDVLNHFYSNCAEPVKYDPTVEINLGSKVFEGCDRDCLYWKQHFKDELKAEAFAYYKENRIAVKDPEKTICYGIYCDDKKQTVEEKITTLEQKEKVRKEHLKELEDIQKCENLKRRDINTGNPEISQVDCKDKEQREKYLAGFE